MTPSRAYWHGWHERGLLGGCVHLYRRLTSKRPVMRRLTHLSADVLAVIAAVFAVALQVGAAAALTGPVVSNDVGGLHPAVIFIVASSPRASAADPLVLVDSAAIHPRYRDCNYDGLRQLVQPPPASAASRAEAGRVSDSGKPPLRSGLSRMQRVVFAAEETGDVVNAAGETYPKVLDPRTGEPIPAPPSGLAKVPVADRVPWGAQERGAFIKSWYDQGYSTPEGGWSDYDIHHIIPREYGGTNEFDNLVPVLRTVHQQEFNAWWLNYGG